MMPSICSKSARTSTRMKSWTTTRSPTQTICAGLVFEVVVFVAADRVEHAVAVAARTAQEVEVLVAPTKSPGPVGGAWQEHAELFAASGHGPGHGHGHGHGYGHGLR